MKTQRHLRILLNLEITGSAGLLFWWILFPVLLPVTNASQGFQDLVLDSRWIIVNLLGLFSGLFLCLGLPGIFLAHYCNFKLYGFWGLLLACTGIILFTAIQYYETLIWPAAAKINPELLYSGGALVSGNSAVLAGLLISGFILGAGYVLFGIAALKTGKYLKTAIWMLMAGVVIFGNGIIFAVRTIGLILFTSGTIWLSFHIRKNLHGQTC